MAPNTGLNKPGVYILRKDKDADVALTPSFTKSERLWTFVKNKIKTTKGEWIRKAVKLVDCWVFLIIKSQTFPFKERLTVSLLIHTEMTENRGKSNSLFSICSANFFFFSYLFILLFKIVSSKIQQRCVAQKSPLSNTCTVAGKKKHTHTHAWTVLVLNFNDRFLGWRKLEKIK